MSIKKPITGVGSIQVKHLTSLYEAARVANKSPGGYSELIKK